MHFADHQQAVCLRSSAVYTLILYTQKLRIAVGEEDHGCAPTLQPKEVSLQLGTVI